MNMEKRWTRKKRAAREAGGPETKPALSGPISLSEPVVAPDDNDAPKRPEAGPSRSAKETDPASLELEADPVSAEPEPSPPKAPEPEAERPEPETVTPEPEREPERKPEPEIASQDPQAPVTPVRPVAYRVKRVQRPKPVEPVEGQPALPEPVSQTDDPAPSLEDRRPAPVEDQIAPAVADVAPVETPPAPIPEPVSRPAEPEPTQAVTDPVEAVAPTPAAPEKTEADTSEPEAADPWARIRKFPIDARKLERNRIITATREDPVHSSFDVLRTKLLRALRDNGWSRVAVTSPTEGCGKTFMAANLALSLSRQGNCRTVVLDLDMRHPALAKAMNVPNTPSIADFLSGKMPAEDFLRRPGRNPHKIGDNVAFGFNTRREEFAAELLQDDVTAKTMKAMQEALKPNVVLLDMPPALVNDDVLAARPLYDGIILVVGGGMTKPQQVRDVERRLGTDTPLLGVVLNKSEDDTSQNYGY